MANLDPGRPPSPQNKTKTIPPPSTSSILSRSMPFTRHTRVQEREHVFIATIHNIAVYAVRADARMALDLVSGAIFQMK
jgi:hypothetical protein